MKILLIIYSLVTLAIGESIPNDSNLTFVQEIVKSYTKQIDKNTGMIKVDEGTYITDITYDNNRLTWQILYNKKELIQAIMKRSKFTLNNATEYIESKKFYNRVLALQRSNDIIAFCNSNNDAMTKLINQGLVLFRNVTWDNGKEFIKYHFSQKTCEKEIRKFEEKRKKIRKEFIKSKDNILYELEIYEINSNNKKEAIKAYIRLKKNIFIPHKSIKILGKNLNFGKKLNYEIIQGKQNKIIKPKLYNEQYLIIKITKIH